MSIGDKVKELVVCIKGTAEYSNMRNSKLLIDQDRTLKTDMEAFGRKQADVYSGRLDKKEFEAVSEELKNKYADLRKRPEVDKYLRSVKAFNELMEKVYKNMGELLEKDLKS